MGKVLTNSGEGGTPVLHVVPDHKATNGAAPLEMKADAPLAPPPEEKAQTATPAETKAAEQEIKDEGVEPEDKDFPERVQRRINAKHKAMKEAQEAAEEADRFAESQYNERKLAESRYEEMAAKYRELEAKVNPPAPVVENKAPNIEDFRGTDGQVDWDKYTDAKSEYAARKAVQDYEANQLKARQEAEQAAFNERQKAKFDKVRKDHPDFDKLREKIKDTPADKVRVYITDYFGASENGAELHYYLMKNPAEVERLNALSPILGIAELGKLEDKLTKPASPPPAPAAAVRVPERGGAPAPITPLSGEGTVGINTDPSRMSYKELRAFRREQAREKASRN